MSRRESWGGLGVALLILAGCASAPKIDPAPKEILVPVARSCVPDNVPAEPDPDSYPATRDKLLGMDEGPERYAAYVADSLMREQRLGIVEPVLKHCR